MDPNADVTLYYFPGNARAFVIRCMLTLAKVKFTNKKITKEEWMKLDKPIEIFEYGYMPVLTINGKAYSQGIAISTYLGKKFGFLGSNVEEEYEIMNVLASFEDLFPEFAHGFFAPSEEDKNKKFKSIAEELLPWILQIWERKIASKKGKYLVGDKLSAADMFYAQIYQTLTHPAWKGLFDEATKKYGSKTLEHGKSILTEELKEFIESPNFVKDFPF